MHKIFENTPERNPITSLFNWTSDGQQKPGLRPRGRVRRIHLKVFPSCVTESTTEAFAYQAKEEGMPVAKE